MSCEIYDDTFMAEKDFRILYRVHLLSESLLTITVILHDYHDIADIAILVAHHQDTIKLTG